MAEVAQVDDHGRHGERHPGGEGHLDEEQHGHPSRCRPWRISHDREEDDERHHRDRHVGPGDDHARQREDLAGAVDLVEERGVQDEALSALGHRRREERPWEQAEVGEQGVGRPARLHLCDPLEECREDEHECQGGDEGPREPEHGLLVAGPYLPFGQTPHQLARPP